MRLSKKAEKLIDKRTKLAMQLNDACKEVDELIYSLGLEDEVASEDWLTGCEVYCNPMASGEAVKNVIRKKVK